MPELPEVETIVQQLNSLIRGKTIVKVEIYDPMVDQSIPAILPVKVNNITRRGKSIIIEIIDRDDHQQFLLIHLRMTGHFHYNKAADFEVSRFHFSDKTFLTHNSIRKFGSIKLFNQSQLDSELNKLGLEPLSEAFTLQNFQNILIKKKRSNIKTILLDQSQIAGIGNIYAQEILYHAKINPLRKAGSLTLSETSLLHDKVVKILKQAIINKGSTVDNYFHIEGSGNYQRFHAVYDKDKCPLGHNITKIDLGGRGTSYCHVCQK